MNSKGQLTVFIIIGIVLLFSTALIVYIRQSVVEYKPPLEVVREQVPNELVPMQQYVISCLDQAAKDAIQRIGVQGGYTFTASLIVNDDNPTEGSAVAFSPGSDVIIPYWWYLKSKNSCRRDCSFASERLDITEVEEQASAFIIDRVKACVNNFNQFRKEFGIRQEEPTVTVRTGRTVIASMSYPITAVKEGRELKMSQFATQVPVNFERIYNFASTIADVEARYGFIERNIMNVVGGFSGLESPLPPISDYELDPGGRRTWKKSEVKEKVKPLLLSYTPALQIHGTTNFVEEKFTNSFRQNAYTSFSLPIVASNKQPFSGLSSEFMYLDWWPMYFDIKGRGVLGDLIGPEEITSSLFSFIAPKRYTNYYQISYPVVVTLRDPTAFNGEGYTFMFALEANVRDNIPVTTDYQGLPLAPQVGGSLLCNLNQRNTGDITFKVSDGVTGLPLPETLITYVCSETACTIGYTARTGADALLKDKLPICAGGAIIASKLGYRDAVIPYDTEAAKSDSFDIKMYKIQSKNLIVRKKPIFRQTECLQEGDDEPAGYVSKETVPILDKTAVCYYFFKDEDAPLLPNEDAVVTFTKVKEDPAEEDFTASIVYHGNESFAATDLVPGQYEINIDMLYNLPTPNGLPSIHIAPRALLVREKGVAGFLGKKKPQTIDAIEFDKSFPDGGVQIDGSNTYFTLTPEHLYSNETLVLYSIWVPSFEVASNGIMTGVIHEDLIQTGKIGEFTDQKRNEVEPTYR